MLKSGKDHLEGLRDGRVVYIGDERVSDVTRHPAFAEAANVVAAMYDAKRAPENRDLFSYEENGERYAMWYLQARTQDDLRRRMRCHKALADMTYGLMGRSPDHVSGFITGMSTNPGVLDTEKHELSSNLVEYYEFCKKNDVFSTYVLLPSQAARMSDFYVKKNLPVPSFQVVREEEDGVVITGMKTVATTAVFCDEIWIGSGLPLAPDQGKQAITCAVKVNTPGVTLWSRQPLSMASSSRFDSPLGWCFDETDCLVMFDDVKVPWERVFVMDDPMRARAIYIETPAHCYGNHQSNVRYWSKMQLITGLCSKVAQATGAYEVPAVREVLGRMASLEALIAGMIHGQIEAAEDWPKGFKTCNRRMMYAALNWCTESYSAIIDQLRDLCGSGAFQMPASISVVHDPKLRSEFETYCQTPQLPALERMKLMKLAWDMVGSEFAGRHQQYEKFYAGHSFIVRSHSFREANWKFFDGIVEKLMAGYDVPEAAPNMNAAE